MKTQSNKLAFNGWFRLYNGLIYCNGVTDVITAIYNKQLICSQPIKNLKRIK